MISIPMGPMNRKSPLVPEMDCHLKDEKPSPEAIVAQFIDADMRHQALSISALVLSTHVWEATVTVIALFLYESSNFDIKK